MVLGLIFWIIGSDTSATSNTFKDNIYNPGQLKPIDSTLKVKLGDLAPDFSLKAVSGKHVSLSQFKGTKNVVISFVPAAGLQYRQVAVRSARYGPDRYHGRQYSHPLRLDQPNGEFVVPRTF